ncbi:phosphoribosylpyrophosphate synthetase [Candidatus Poribacteria bacterium]|nr:MAG: phosphoribosylpyrophosphate synthetase [Candidatus Poribacteria bacterium]
MSTPIDQQVSDDFRLFAGSANPALAKEIAAILGVELGKITIGPFPNLETRVQIEESIRGTDIYIVQPTSQPANENLMELLITIDAMKRASARQITAIIPYFGYARQDHKTTGREPISAKLVANLLTTAGASRVMAIDLHVPQIQGFFDIPMDHLTAVTTLANYFREKQVENGVVVAPDAGRVKLAGKYADILGLPLAIMHKRRAGVDGQDVQFVELVGEVNGKTPIVIDDEIQTGGSIHQQAIALAAAGAKPAYVSIAHPILVGPALERLDHSSIREVVTTNTIPVPAEKQLDGKVKVLSIAPLLSQAILRVHQHRSVSQVFRDQKLDFPV